MDDRLAFLIDSDDSPKTRKYKRVVYEYPDEFISLVLRYGRYGTKKLAYKYWKLLSDEDKIIINEHLPAYQNCVVYKKRLENYLRDREFENPVFQDGRVVFDPEIYLQTRKGYFDFMPVWSFYGSKGNIKKAFNEWKLLTDEQRKIAMRHISFYSIVIDDREKPFFEDYLHQGIWRTGQDELEEKFARCF